MERIWIAKRKEIDKRSDKEAECRLVVESSMHSL